MLSYFFDFLFPHGCLHCKKRIYDNTLFCCACQKDCLFAGSPSYLSLVQLCEESNSKKALETLAALVITMLIQQDLFGFDSILYLKKDSLEEKLATLLAKKYQLAKKVSYKKIDPRDSKILFLKKGETEQIAFYLDVLTKKEKEKIQVFDLY